MTHETPIAEPSPSATSDGGEVPAKLLPATPSQRRDEALLTETSTGYEP
jgi:hypothetical protein